MSGTDKTEENFTWDAYLEATETEPVPPIAFQHVSEEKTANNYEGLAVEFRPPTCKNYWIAQITLQCGPFIRLKWLGDVEPVHEHWGNFQDLDIKPIGFASKNAHVVQPTPELARKIGSWPTILREFLATIPATLPGEFHQVKGPKWVEIQEGMCVEIQDETEPYSLWPANVNTNRGGRLKLTYLNCSHLPSFWLFYTSHRIRPTKTAQRDGFQYKPPCETCLQAEWQANLDFSNLTPIPAHLVSDWNPESHRLESGSKVEAIDPNNPFSLEPAVVQVVDATFFQLDLASGKKRCSYLSDPYVLPPGFAKEYGVTDSIDVIHSKNSLSERNLVQAEELGMILNAKMEAAHPQMPEQIHVATIIGIYSHIVKVKLDTDGLEFYVNSSNCDIFPIDWHKAYGFKLYTPDCISSFSKPEPESEPKPKDITTVPDLNAANPLMWCPAIYFNFRCFVGPWLSRNKLTALPKKVGPGPVNLVLKEVLTLLLGVAYKPGWVLKQLQGDIGVPAPPGMYLETIKARYKNCTYRGLVPLASHVGKVPDFFRLIASRLQICLRLISFELVGENCPEQCRKQTKVPCPPRRHGKNSHHQKDSKRKEICEEDLENKRPKYDDYLIDSNSCYNLENGGDETLSKKGLYKKKKGRPPKILPGMGHPDLPPLNVFNITTNPMHWTPSQVYDFVQQADCAALAHKLLKEEVDGRAFLLLTLPTVLDFLTLSPHLALQLCSVVASLRYTYVKLYVDKEV